MKIIGTGSSIPAIRVTNEDITDNPKWVSDKLGIWERGKTSLGSSALGAKAALRAIEDAYLEPENIDMIIVATATPEKLNPSTAAIIQDKIGAYTAVAFDISAVCSGFVYAMAMAEEFLHRYKHILVIGTDTFTHITDWSHRDCVYFGDGAGAVVVTQGENKSHYVLGADGRGNCDFKTDHGGTFEMDSGAVYRAGVKFMPDVINDVLDIAELAIEDITWMLPHQGSITMLKEVARCIGIPWNRVKTNMKWYGNTAGACIPVLLDECKDEFKDGDIILLTAIGSGWAYGAIIIEWE